MDAGPSHPVQAKVDPFASLASRPAPPDAAAAPVEQVCQPDFHDCTCYLYMLCVHVDTYMYVQQC